MKVNCRQCEHYYVTWDPKHPYGCRGFGIKSRSNPSQLVLATSGRECQLFKPKANRR